MTVHGQIYHNTSAVQVEVRSLMDSAEANEHRLNYPANDVCDRELMEQLDILLRLYNPYAQVYKNMRQMIEDELAFVFKSPDGIPPENRDVVGYLRIPESGQGLVRIDTNKPMCDPMTYPILFPMGDQGWHCNMNHANQNQNQETVDDDGLETEEEPEVANEVNPEADPEEPILRRRGP